MKTRIAMCVWIATLAALMGSSPVAGEFVLVEDGIAKAPIVVFEDAPPLTRQAAEELAQYIERTTGARPELIEGRPDPIPESAVWVGFQPAMEEVFPGLDFQFEHPEEILIAANENHLAILGRDVWDPDHMVVRHRRTTLEGVQQEYGTVNAVYTFLQDHLGVRWLWPSELGTDILERDTVAFAPFERRYHPQIRGRSGLLRFSGQHGGWAVSSDWVRVQRLQLDSLDFHGGHGFGTWWDRFHETHPEYFALQPDGTRGGGERPYPRASTVKICVSNPAVWERWLALVEEQLESNPNQKVFNAAANDSNLSGHCVCEHCRAWDHPDGEPWRLSWRGISQEYVALSDRETTFANTLARRLKERYPDRDYFVSIIGYGPMVPAPVEAVPDDNVIVAMVGPFWSPEGGRWRERHEGWARVTKNYGWRPNTGSPAGWRHGFPDVPLSRMAESFRYLADLGVISMLVDSNWEHWGTQGPLNYMMAQLAWDPRQDEQEILDDYCRRGFGPAAEQVRAYWRLMEDTRNHFRDTYGSWNVNDHWSDFIKTYNADLFERAEALLDEAADQAAGSDLYTRRVAFVRAGLEYTRLAVEGRAAIELYERSDGADEEAKRIAVEKWEALDRLQDEHPLAVNWVSLGGARSPMTASFLPSISRRWR